MLPCGKKRGFVKQVFKVCAGETDCHLRKIFEIDIGSERFVLGVNFKNILSTLCVGAINGYLPVKSARAKQRGVKNIGAVGCRHNYNSRI